MDVLLLGRRPIDLEGMAAYIDRDDVVLHGGTNLDDVASVLEATEIDTVIMGAGIPLEDRLDIIRHVFSTSTSTTVHMKDRDSGPAGMAPFVRRVLAGLA